MSTTPINKVVAAATSQEPIAGEILLAKEEKRFVVGDPGTNYVFRSGKVRCAVDGTISSSDPKEIEELKWFPEYTEAHADLIQEAVNGLSTLVNLSETTR